MKQKTITKSGNFTSYNQATEIDSSLDPNTAHAVQQGSDRDTSLLLSVLPIENQGFDLNKAEFKYDLNISFNRPIKDLLS